MNENEEKLTNPQAVEILRRAVIERAAARRQYEAACKEYVDEIVSVLTRIREERGMTWRQMQRLVPRPDDGGFFTFQYLNQVINGTPPSDGLIEALIRGLEEDGT